MSQLGADGPGPQGPYGYGPQGGPPGRTVHSGATTSMYLGIGAIFTAGLLSIPAILIAKKANKEIAERPNTFSNEGQATVGLICGWVGVAILVLTVFKSVLGPSADKVAKEAVPDAGATALKSWSCVGTNEKLTAECTAGDGCALLKENEPSLCLARYIDLRKAGSINNWKQDGAWAAKEGKIAIVQYSDLKDDSTDPKCRLTKNGARIHICGATGGQFLGLVRLDRYEKHMLTDDLWATAIPGVESERFQAALDVHDLIMRAQAPSASAADKIRLLDTIRDATDAAKQKAHAEIVMASSFDLAALRKEESALRSVVEQEKQAAADKKRVEAEARHKLLADDAFERMLAVSEPLSSIAKDAWAIPPRGRCGTEAPGADEFTRRTEESTRAQKARRIAKRLFAVEVKAEKNNPYDFANHVQKIDLTTTEDFAIGSGQVVKTEALMSSVCCNLLTNACRPADGFFGAKCKNALEELREQPSGSHTSLNDGVKSTVVSIPQRTDDAERLKDATWRAQVIVAVSGAVRLCDDTSERDSIYTGRVVGMRVSAGDEVVHKKADVKVSLEEAEAGPEAWSSKP